MSTPNLLAAGLADPVHDAQNTFRSVLDALARPGRRTTLQAPQAPLPLGAALASLLLTLTDGDTPVWWQQGDTGLEQWLRFHTGAAVARQAGDAAFAVITSASALPPLDTFSLGSAAAPEVSCTLLVELPSLDTGSAMAWRGPGIQDMHTVRLAGLPDGFWTQWQTNQASFPQGVDIVFTCGDALIGLPRTTQAHALQPLESV